MSKRVDEFFARHSRWPSIKAFSDEVRVDWIDNACKQGYKPYQTLKAPSDYVTRTVYDTKWILYGNVK